MFDIEIDPSELGELMEREVHEFRKEVAVAVVDACTEGAKEAVNSRLYQDRTAELTASIRGGEQVILTFDGAESFITAGIGLGRSRPKGASDSYASYVEEWEVGQRGQGFMDLAAAKAEQVLTDKINESVRDLENRLNSK